MCVGASPALILLGFSIRACALGQEKEDRIVVIIGVVTLTSSPHRPTDSTLDPGYRRIAVWKTGMAPAVLVGYVDAAEEAYFARHGRPSHNVKPISSAPHIAAEKGLLEWTLEIDMASIPKNNYRVGLRVFL